MAPEVLAALLGVAVVLVFFFSNQRRRKQESESDPGEPLYATRDVLGQVRDAPDDEDLPAVPGSETGPWWLILIAALFIYILITTLW